MPCTSVNCVGKCTYVSLIQNRISFLFSRKYKMSNKQTYRLCDIYIYFFNKNYLMDQYIFCCQPIPSIEIVI